MARFHDREPVILDPEDWQAWLDGTDDLDLTTPWDDDAFQVLPAAAMKGRQKARAGTQ
jgi:putative SOS response-associated peptidase YedK